MLTRKLPVKKVILFLLPLIIVFAFEIIFIRYYFSQEKFIYYWDWGGFEQVTNELSVLFPSQMGALMEYLKGSLHTDYNFYYALPILPIIHFLEPSRLSYLLGVVILYQFPFTLAMGWLGYSLIRQKRLINFMVPVLLSAIIPTVWAATVRGYPDVVGALFVCLAAGVYLASYPETKWWHYLLVGFFLAWACILRRYNLYAVVAFFLSAAILFFFEFLDRYKDGHKIPWGFLIRKIELFGASGIMLVLTLRVFAWPFLKNILTTNYTELYSSYMLPINKIVDFLFTSYGGVIWLLAVFGYMAGVFSRRIYRGRIALLGTWFFIQMLFWIFLVRQIGYHYTLIITMFIVVGVAVFFSIVISNFNRIPFVSVIILFILFFGLNFSQSFTFIDLPSVFRPLIYVFSSTYPPLKRTDYSEIVRLIDSLRSIAGNGQEIYVADSSGLMNYDIVVKAEKQLYPKDLKLRLLVTPQIDSRDYYPLEQFIQSDYVLVSTPFQYHVGNGNQQKVVKFIHDVYQNQWELSRDFEKLPGEFNLGDGSVHLSIYRRVQKTDLQTAIMALDRMIAYIGQRPGSQKDWISVSKSNLQAISVEMGSRYSFQLQPEDLAGQNEVQVLYAGRLPVNGELAVQLEGRPEQIPELQVGLIVCDSQGRVISQSFIDAKAEEMLFPFDHQGNSDWYGVVAFRKIAGEERDIPGSILVHFGMKN